MVHPTKQIDIGAVACTAELATRRGKRGDRRPGIGSRGVPVSVCNSRVVDDAAETIDDAAY